MPEFDRTAAILAELESLNDDTTAQLAEITFATQDDHGSLEILRDSIADEYRQGNVDSRDLYATARTVGADVAGRGDRMARFAAVYDIERLTVAAEYGEDDGVCVAGIDTIGEVVRAALATRFTHAAHQLLTYLENDADDKETDHVDDDSDDTDDSDSGGGDLG